MTEDTEALVVLERMLAMTLRQGTRIATTIVIVGLAVAWFGTGGHPRRGSPPMPIVDAGILLFMMLPTARVGLMMLAFLRARDYRFAATAAAVLAVIALGFALSMLTHARP